MKKLLLAVLAVTSFSALAQNLDRDIQRKIERLNELSRRGDVGRLSYGEKSDLDRSLDNSLRILRDDDRRPAPGPLPIPTPQRPGRGPRYSTQATAMIIDHLGKSKVLNFGGNNPGDILSQCNSQLSSTNMSIFSSIVMTSNNNPYEIVSIYTSQKSEVCTQIVNRMKPGRPDWQFIDVSGLISDHLGKSVSINLDGDRGEVLDQCLDQVSKSGFRIFSKINVSVNRGSLVNKNIYVQGAGTACKELAVLLNQQAP